MTWTSLVSSDLFTGIKADLVTVAGGVIGLTVIILGLVVIVRAIGR